MLITTATTNLLQLLMYLISIPDFAGLMLEGGEREAKTQIKPRLNP